MNLLIFLTHPEPTRSGYEKYLAPRHPELTIKTFGTRDEAIAAAIDMAGRLGDTDAEVIVRDAVPTSGRSSYRAREILLEVLKQFAAACFGFHAGGICTQQNHSVGLRRKASG